VRFCTNGHAVTSEGGIFIFQCGPFFLSKRAYSELWGSVHLQCHVPSSTVDWGANSQVNLSIHHSAGSRFHLHAPFPIIYIVLPLSFMADLQSEFFMVSSLAI
jgi:hypothetical protein